MGLRVWVRDYPQGAIQEESGMLPLHGYITFDHNTGENGGVISLSNIVPLHFDPQYTMRLFNNTATGYGGAIYNNGKQTEFMRSEFCVFRIRECCVSAELITFIDNHAPQGGHTIYTTPIYKCHSCHNKFGYDCDLLDVMSYLNITRLSGDINDTQVLSFPEKVNYCGCSDPNLCNGTSPYLTTYPGRTVKMNITSLDQQNHLSPSVVYTQVDTDGVQSQNKMLGP